MTEVITWEVPNTVVYVLSEVQRIKQIHAFSLGYFKRSSSAKALNGARSSERAASQFAKRTSKPARIEAATKARSCSI